MEKGARLLVVILLVAIVAGSLVVALVPAYRSSVAAIWQGRPEESPIWRSNAGYYTEVVLPEREGAAHESE